MSDSFGGTTEIAAVRLVARDGPRLSAFYEGLFGPSAAMWFEIIHRPDAARAEKTDAGLFHTAILLPDRAALAAFATHLSALGVRLDGASDHGVSEALYLSDPEGNGLEVYADRARDDWPRDHKGAINLVTKRLDLQKLAVDLDAAWTRAPAGSKIGHAHLKVGDAVEAERFYTRALGLDVMARRDGAAFMSWNGYHHHIGANHWASAGATERSRPRKTAGLDAIRLTAPIDRARELVDPWGTVIEIERL